VLVLSRRRGRLGLGKRWMEIILEGSRIVYGWLVLGKPKKCQRLDKLGAIKIRNQISLPKSLNQRLNKKHLIC
jgi:hypothetical protein